MSTPTYEKIQHIELSSAGTITFSSIPQTFTDLMLVISARGAADDPNGTITFNTGGTYTRRRLYGTGSATNSDTIIDFQMSSSVMTASTFGSISIYIPNYTSSNAKSYSVDSASETNATLSYQAIVAGLWSGTAAITTINLTPYSGGNFAAGSSATLYGIKSIPSAPKATGGIISYVNGYWVHTFTSSGTFTPTQNLSNVEYLVVAGGGAGGEPDTGGSSGGGGGAGGYRSSVVGESSGGGASAESRLSLTASTNYTVTVGAGGTIGGGFSVDGTNGNNSTFDTITATGGGRGARSTGAGPVDGSSGGSGGGGASGGAGGSGTANQGRAGGTTLGITGFYAGGGGGANTAGSPATSGGAGNGGAGLASSITGTSITRAGGAGGGTYNGSVATGGAGGGGNGAASNSFASTAGQANTGSGGGGGARLTTGGRMAASNGGSGIVVVRYQ